MPVLIPAVSPRVVFNLACIATAFDVISLVLACVGTGHPVWLQSHASHPLNNAMTPDLALASGLWVAGLVWSGEPAVHQPSNSSTTTFGDWVGNATHYGPALGNGTITTAREVWLSDAFKYWPELLRGDLCNHGAQTTALYQLWTDPLQLCEVPPTNTTVISVRGVQLPAHLLAAQVMSVFAVASATLSIVTGLAATFVSPAGRNRAIRATRACAATCSLLCFVSAVVAVSAFRAWPYVRNLLSTTVHGVSANAYLAMVEATAGELVPVAQVMELGPAFYCMVVVAVVAVAAATLHILCITLFVKKDGTYSGLDEPIGVIADDDGPKIEAVTFA